MHKNGIVMTQIDISPSDAVCLTWHNLRWHHGHSIYYRQQKERLWWHKEGSFWWQWFNNFLNKNTQILHETRVFYMYTSPSSCAAPNGYLRLQAQKNWYSFYAIVKGSTYKRFKIQNVHEGHKLLLWESIINLVYEFPIVHSGRWITPRT